jgi:hypothetical protein
MFAVEMCSSITLSTPPLLTVRERNLGLLAGMTGGKLPGIDGSFVENFPLVPSVVNDQPAAWVFWGKPARLRTATDLALRSAVHNPHALLTLLPNISLSIYKGLP